MTAALARLLPWMQHRRRFLVAPMTNKHTRKAQPGATAAVAAPRRCFVALGTIASSAPPAALLHALRELRPQLEIRLQPAGAAGRYRVELRRDEPAVMHMDRTHGSHAPAQSIDAWLRIKS